MNNKMLLLAISIVISTSLRAGDERISGQLGELSGAPSSSAQDNRIRKLNELHVVLSEIQKELHKHDIEITKEDITFIAQLEVACKELEAQLGIKITPEALFDQMKETSQQLADYMQKLQEDGLDFIPPVELLDLFEKKTAELERVQGKNALLGFLALAAGGSGGIAAGTFYAKEIKDFKTTLKNAVIEQILNILPKMTQATEGLLEHATSLSPTKKKALHLLLSSVVDAIGAGCQYSNRASREISNAPILTMCQNTVQQHRQGNRQSPRALVDAFILTLDETGDLPKLGSEQLYRPTVKDFALLFTSSLSEKAIDAIPYAQKDTRYLPILTKNQLICAGKESAKEVVHTFIEARLSAANATNTPPVTARDLVQTGVQAVARNVAHEASYSLIAQLIHKKAAPKAEQYLGKDTADILKQAFPEDGVAKGMKQHFMKAATIHAATWCANKLANLAALISLRSLINSGYVRIPIII